jgi:uncharacterized protein affecting Mg2+/Co2+ transport
MKKLYFAAALLAALPMSAQTPIFSESFEGETLPDTWIARSANGSNNAVWSLENYTNVNAKIGQPDDAGSGLAKSTTGGYSTVGGVLPDSWLISPQVKIDGTAYLNFYYSYNLTYNSNVNLTANQKTKFSVLVSAGGSEADDFTDEVFFDVGEGLASWRQVSIDLSKYAGRTIRIAFRNYNTEIHATQSSMITQRLYIDNVQVTDTPAYDVAIASASDFASGTITTQPLTVSVRNYGHDVDGFTASYSVNGGAAVTETVQHALKQGDTYSYTFSQPLQFTGTGTQSVVVSAAIDNDKFTANNTVTKTLNIAPQASLPIDLPSSSTSTDLVSTLSGSYTNPRGWMYFGDDYESWVYTEAGATAYLYTAKSYHMTPGVYSAVVGYTCTGGTAQLNLHAFHSVGDFGEPIASRTLSQSVESISYATLVFNIDKEDDYLLAFSVSGMNKTEQLTMPELDVDVASTTPDIAVVNISTPTGYIIGSNYKVTAQFSNNSGVDAVNVPVSYVLGDDSGSGTIDIIKAGESVSYTFSKKVTVPDAIGTYQLSVKASLADDATTDNNEQTTTLATYTPLSMPWRDSFEDDDATAHWTVVNSDNDMTYWGITDEYSWDGDNLMLLNDFRTTKQNDWLISPALSISGAARVAFYYGNLSSSYATSKVSVYLTQSIDPDEIVKDGMLIKEFDDESVSINYLSVPFTPQAAGTYYVAIHVDGGIEPFYVDDVRVDTASEVYVTAAESTAGEAGYVINDAEVKMTVVNGCSRGLMAVAVCYSVADAEGNAVGEDVIEAIPYIAAGEAYEYTFTQKLTITTPGTYTITTKIVSLDDTDLNNNSVALPETIVLAEKSVPYVAGFEDDEDDYALALSGGWERSSLGVYAGSAALNAYSRAKDSEKGDWAFLHKLWLDAGTYDFCFFWRTSGGNTGDAYRKSFSIYLGSAPSADKMTTRLFEGNDLLNASELAQKEMTTFTVDAAGYYYVGVQNVSTTTSGWIAVDDITIKRPTEGISVGKGNDAYVSDIAANSDEWYHYHPSSNIRQWTVATDDDEDGGASYFKATESEDWSGNIQKASFLEAPALNLEAYNTYAITLSYAISPYLASTELGTENSLDLYISTVDNPDAFAKKFSFKELNEVKTETVKYVAQSSGLHYLAFRPSSADETVYSIYSLSVENTGETGVNDVAVDAEHTVTVIGKTVTADGVIEAYTTLGTLAARAIGSITLPAGTYILRVGSTVTKAIIR